jgi:hypothetical protein
MSRRAGVLSFRVTTLFAFLRGWLSADAGVAQLEPGRIHRRGLTRVNLAQRHAATNNDKILRQIWFFVSGSGGLP